MALAADDTYAAPSGVTIRGGRFPALPSWAPAAGTFANISLNTMNAVRPSGWPTSGDIAGPFANWSGGVLATDFSTLGGYVVHGSGHLTSGTPVWAGVWVFDLDTLLWVGRNVPAAPLEERPASSIYYNQYYESLDSATLGHTYAPHTYDGLIYQRASQGGGTNGSLLRFMYPGAPTTQSVHQFDLSSATAPPVRVIDSIPSHDSYAAAARDDSRGGVWLLSYIGQGPLKFIDFDDWSVTNHPGIAYNEQGNHNLLYLPAPYDCLVGFGTSLDASGISVWVCPFVGNTPQGFTKVSFTGPEITDGRSGGCWSTILNCIVSYPSSGSTTVHKLTPPVGSLTAGTWVWSTVSMTGAGGATPSQSGSNQNGAWSRFIEHVPSRSFIWCDSVSGPVQAWRLPGM